MKREPTVPAEEFARHAWWAALQAAVLVGINLHALWRPWLRGLVTEDFVRVVGPLSIVAAVQLTGELILTSARSYRHVHFFAAVGSAAGFIATLVMLVVFPFSLPAWLAVALRVVMVLGAAGNAGAFFVNLLQFVGGGGPRPIFPAR